MTKCEMEHEHLNKGLRVVMSVYQSGEICLRPHELVVTGKGGPTIYVRPADQGRVAFCAVKGDHVGERIARKLTDVYQRLYGPTN